MHIKRPIEGKDVFFFILVLTFSVGLVIEYVSLERAFYYWDYSAYHLMTRDIVSGFNHSPLFVLTKILISFQHEYNYFFTIPLILLSFVFGTNRLGYILSLTLAYQIPFALINGLIAVKVIKGPVRAVFWSAVWFTLLTPMAWAPTLRGYPDVGAASLIGLAIWIYLIDISFQNRWQYIGIGLSLSISILFRRHYVYDVGTFYLALILFELIRVFHSYQNDHARFIQNISQSSKKIGLSVGITLGCVIIIDFPILFQIFTKNYSALYESYTTNLWDTVSTFLSYFGWMTWIFILIGFGLGIYTSVTKRLPSLFLCIFGMISLFVWTIIIRITATHYTLHIALICIIGITILFWTIWTQTKGIKRIAAISVFALLTFINFFVSLAPVGYPALLKPMFSKAYPPIIREDYKEILDLVDYLRVKAGDGQPILVAASSSLLNDNLLKNVEDSLFDDPRLVFLKAPQIDSRDFYPTENLLKAKIVVITLPFEQSLKDPNEQRVVSSVVEAFSQNWEIASDFVLLPEQFQLEDGALIQIYQRIRSTSIETAIRTSNKIIDYVDRFPGSQPDWVTIRHPETFKLSMLGKYSYSLNFNNDSLAANEPVLVLLYAREEPLNGQIIGSLEYSGLDCTPVLIEFVITDPEGNAIETLGSNMADLQRNQSFSLPLHKADQDDLLVIAESENQSLDNNECVIKMDWEFQK